MNAYDFLLSLDRLEGRLIDETIDCLYPKERRGGRRVVRTLLIAAVLASLFTAAAFASDFLGFREAIMSNPAALAGYRTVPSRTRTGARRRGICPTARMSA